MIPEDFLSSLTLLIVSVMFSGPIFFVGWLYLRNTKQTQHSLLRGPYWFLGILRYMIEKVGPEFRFYITDDDNQGKPVSRVKFVSIIKAAKYLKTLVSFGSKREFSDPGLYLRNAMFPKLNGELDVDNSFKISTQKYLIDKDGIFFHTEKRIEEEVRSLMPDRGEIHHTRPRPKGVSWV